MRSPNISCLPAMKHSCSKKILGFCNVHYGLLSDGHEAMLLAPKIESLLCPFCWHLPRGARMAGPPPKNSWGCQFPTTPLTQRINHIPITLRTIPVMVKKTHPTQICCENHARKMRTFFIRRLEPKTRSSLPR